MSAPSIHAHEERGARVLGRRNPVLLLGIVAYASVAAIPDPMTWPARVAVALPIVGLVFLVLRRGWLRPRLAVAESAMTKAGAIPPIVWVLLLAILAFVQLSHFYAEPRSIYPTLSSLAEEPLGLYPVRAAAFAVWMWVGWYLVDR